MAERYWVNDLADGDGNAADNWSASDGGAGGAGFTSADVLNYTSSEVSDCLFSAAVTCAGIATADGYTGKIDGNGQDITVNGNLVTLGDDATLDFGGGDWTVTGDVDLAAVKTVLYNTGLLNLTGTGTVSLKAARILPALVINTSGTITLGSNIICVSLTLSAGTFSIAGYDITTIASGDLIISAGAVITGTDLNGATIGVAGNLSVTGEADAFLDMEATAAWTLTVVGTATVSYATVAYSDASGGTEIATNFCVDKGNNSNWFFALGSISLSQEYLRVSLANCATFQDWTGTSDANEAFTKIYHEGLPAPANDADAYTLAELEAYRPYALVYTAEDQGFGRTVIGSGDTTRDWGNLRLQLVENVTESVGDEPSSTANRRFKNTVGQIIDELCDLSGQGGYLAFDTIRVEYGPYWGLPDEVPSKGRYQGVTLAISWGGRR